MLSESTVVFVDADNTLWDTDRVYADAQLTMLENVESFIGKKVTTRDRLFYVRAIDQAIAEEHHSGLRYPPRFLVKALSLALTTGATPAQSARMAWVGSQECIPEDKTIAIVDAYLRDLKRLPALRDGVKKGLNTLKKGGHTIFILTEGNRQKVLDLLQHYELVNTIDRVIESKKGPRLFERVLKLTQNSENAVMIGDQLDRDIQPAKKAGLTTIYFPGGFKPKWHPSEVSISPDKTIRNFSEAVTYIKKNA